MKQERVSGHGSGWLDGKDILISVAIPCFNDAGTLPRALASLVAQTHANWECLVVDDGSMDDVKGVVERLGDARVRYFRFEENRGRGAARQKTLELARGEFFCMLDADDWYYPEKLERQLAVMLEHPELALVSLGMAVVGEGERLVGVRRADGAGERAVIKRRMEGLQDIEFAFPPSMFRGDVARAHAFDEGLRECEDPDFLWRALQGQSYGVMPAVLYAYHEAYSEAEMRAAISKYGVHRRILRKYVLRYPGQVVKKYVRSYVKGAVYGASLAVGRGRFLFARRNVEASEEDLRSFEGARAVVDRACEELF